MESENLSLIIPTFKRERQLNKILNSLKKQHKNNFKLEIIICDSFSGYIEKNFPKETDNFKIKYFNIEDNILSSKRNYGIKKTQFVNFSFVARVTKADFLFLFALSLRASSPPSTTCFKT